MAGHPFNASLRAAIGLAALLSLCAIGCASVINMARPDRDENGLTLILPGIDSANARHWNVAAGLDDAGVKTTVKVHDWTTGTPALGLIHLRYLDRNKTQAAALAERIVKYQDEYPGRPVHLIGHSGGGAMTLLALDALPDDRQITTATLLSPAISPDYDLREALAKSKYGIWHYCSYGDAAHLIAGTTLLGTVDGQYSPSAGAIGFELPEDADAEDRESYRTKLHEVPYDFSMVLDGHFGGHFGGLSRAFVRDHVAIPLLDTHQDEQPRATPDERLEELLR